MAYENSIQKQFGHLYNQYRQRLVIIARRYVRDRMVAEDIVADSFVAFWNNRDKISSETNIPAYLLTIVKNNCMNWLQSQQIHFRIEEQMASVQARMNEANIRSLNSMDPGNIFAKDVQEIVAQVITKMPDLTREVFLMSRSSGMTYAEIAEELSISNRRVTSEMQAALATLRKALKDYMPAWLLTLYLLNAFNQIPPPAHHSDNGFSIQQETNISTQTADQV